MRIGLSLWPLLIFALGGLAHAHPSHGTLAEVEFVDGRLEVALQVQMPQLDRACADIGVPGEAGAKQLVSEHFVVSRKDGKPLPVKWIGMESKVFVAWLYFEVALDAPLNEYRLRHTLFMGREAKQVNTVLLKRGTRRTTLALTRNQSVAQLGFPKEKKGKNER